MSWKLLASLPLLLILLLPSTARAGLTGDAAYAASNATSEHCSEGWGEHSTKAGALKVVLDALNQVQIAYQASPEPFLLYWRGTLYQCLGQYEDAITDLEAFVEAERGNPTYAQQVKAAELQLRRSGTRVSAAGAGAAAGWIRRTDPFETTLQYGAGAAARSRVCTDSLDEGFYAASCQGSPEETPFAITAAPSDGRVALTGFFAAPIGFGVAGTAQWAMADESKDETEGGWLKNNSIDWGITHPTFVLSAGPVLRLANWRSSNRALGLRIEPSFAVGVAWFEPLAGDRFWDEEDLSFQTLGGEWRTLHLGASIRVEFQAEVGNRAVFLADARGVFFAPSGPDRIEQTRPAGGNIQIPLDPTQADRLQVDGGVGALFQAHDSGNVSLGPFLRVTFEGRWLTFPEGDEYAWSLPGAVSDSPTHKVFSTQRLKGAITAGLTLHFGG